MVERRSSFRRTAEPETPPPAPAVPPPLNIDKFQPSAKPRVDREAAATARELAEKEGHTLHRVSAVPPIRRQKGRTKISEVTGAAIKRPDEPRTQLNITIPHSVARRFKALEATTQMKAWELLEVLMDTYERK